MGFDEICKFCNHKMELVDNYRRGDSVYKFYIYWCPHCGTLLNWWDEKPIQDDDWSEPTMTKDM